MRTEVLQPGRSVKITLTSGERMDNLREACARVTIHMRDGKYPALDSKHFFKRAPDGPTMTITFKNPPIPNEDVGAVLGAIKNEMPSGFSAFLNRLFG